MKRITRTICCAAALSVMASAAAAGTRHYFYAACRHESHGSLGYTGKRHSHAADAERDCAVHRETYPRHPCRIRPIDY